MFEDKMVIFRVVLDYIWRVATNLIVLLVVLYVFSNLHERFEVIVVSILGFIYLTVARSTWELGAGLSLVSGLIDDNFVKMRRLLHDSALAGDEMAVSERKSKFEAHIGKGLVDLAFRIIIWIVCLYQLFTHL